MANSPRLCTARLGAASSPKKAVPPHQTKETRRVEIGVCVFSRDAGERTELILSDSQIFGGRLATVARFFVAHLGTLIEAAQPRFFDGRNVHEDILAAAIGLNETISLRRVKPLHSTCRH
jgi:hypothetical protein